MQMLHEGGQHDKAELECMHMQREMNEAALLSSCMKEQPV